jgi:hypothetical protein
VSEIKFYQFDRLKVLNPIHKAAEPAVAKLKAYRELVLSIAN